MWHMHKHHGSSLSRCSHMYALAFICGHSQWQLLSWALCWSVLVRMVARSGSVLLEHCYTSESPGERIQIPVPRPSTATINSDSLGVGLRHQWFLELPRWFQCVASLRTRSLIQCSQTLTCIRIIKGLIKMEVSSGVLGGPEILHFWQAPRQRGRWYYSKVHTLSSKAVVLSNSCSSALKIIFQNSQVLSLWFSPPHLSVGPIYFVPSLLFCRYPTAIVLRQSHLIIDLNTLFSTVE